MKDSKISSETLIKISEKILEVSGNPKDYLEVAATLESMGYSDQRIKNDFGYCDVFEISHEIFDLLLNNEKSINDKESTEKDSKYNVGRIILDIIRGILSVCPLIISMFSVFLINFSLWSFMDITIAGVERATSIAFATILSMIVSGGFTQAFLRNGYALIEQSYYKCLWNTYVHYFKLGMITCVAIATVASILGMFTGVYKLENILIFDFYFFLLTALWLNVQINNLIRGELLFVVNLLVSIGVVYYLKEALNMNIVYSQVLGMIFFIVINSIVLKLIFFLLVKGKKSKDAAGDYKPRLLINIYLLAPYFLYGLMYYAIIFMDRLLAWTANSRIILEPVMRMKGEYDLGMNWGILAILVPTIFIELYIKMLINNVLKAKKRYSIADQKEFQRKNVHQFLTYMIVFFIISVVGALISVGAINNIISYYNIELGPYFSNVSRDVFMLGIVGYIFIILGLLNNIYLLYFSQGKLIVKLLAISLGVNIIVGFTLSRIFDYYFAVFGFLAGAITFFVLGLYYSYNILKSMDYHLYRNS